VGYLRGYPSASPNKVRANRHDDGWDWPTYCRTVYTTTDKVLGKVLFLGDSISRAFANWQWVFYGAAKRTAEDIAAIGYFLGDVPSDGTTHDVDCDNGWYLAAADVTSGRSFTTANGLGSGEFLAGSGLPGTAMPAVTDTQVHARATLHDGATYPNNLHIDTVLKAFSDAQFAFVQFNAESVEHPEIVTNLAAICDKLEAAHIVPILCTITPRSDEAGLIYAPIYNAAIRALAASRNLPLCDLYQEFLWRRPAGTWDGTLVLPEGSGNPHLTASGAGYDAESSPYVDGGRVSTHTTGAATLNVGYLLRAWLIVQKAKEVREALEKTLLTIDDLVWQGQAKFPSYGAGLESAQGCTAWSGGALAVRYINGERHFLVPMYTNYGLYGGDSQIGALVEWKAPALVKDVIGAANLMERVKIGEVYQEWAAADWLLGAQIKAKFGGGQGRIGGLYWDQTTGLLWYVLYHGYTNSSNAFLGATQLLPNGAVGNKYGLWVYHAIGDQGYSRAVQGWIVPVPTSDQASLGGKKVGMGCWPVGGGMGDYTHFGPGLILFGDFPSTSGETEDAVIAPGFGIMDYTIEHKVAPWPACHRNNDYTPAGLHHHTDGWVYDASGPTWTRFPYNTSANYTFPGDLGDCLYFSPGAGATTSHNLYFYASVPNSGGGVCIWEYSKGGNVWADLSPTFTVGTNHLSTNETNGYWATIPPDWQTDTVNGVGPGYWIRLRVTSALGSAVTVAGTVYHYPSTNDPAPAPDGSVGYWVATEDTPGNFIWVDTPAKHGILCFGRQSHGHVWYGVGQCYADEVALLNPWNPMHSSYGYMSDDIRPRLFVFDPEDLKAAYLDGQGDATNVAPAAEYDWTADFPSDPSHHIAYLNEQPALNGWPFLSNVFANSGFFDASVNQVIWTPGFTWKSGESPLPTLQVFNVAG
jgi:hypothetical protein